MPNDDLGQFLIEYEEYMQGKRAYADLPVLGSVFNHIQQTLARDTRNQLDRLCELVDWAKSRIMHCTRMIADEKLSHELVVAAQYERRTLEAVLRIVQGNGSR